MSLPTEAHFSIILLNLDMTVQLFVPCFIDQLYPQVAFNTIKVLEKAGCVVKYNEQQTCCGQPAFNAGFWGESKDVCTKFVQDFDGADYIAEVFLNGSFLGTHEGFFSDFEFDCTPYLHDGENTLVVTGAYRKQWADLTGAPETQHLKRNQ